MIKVHLKSLSPYIFGLIINFLILEISPLTAVAQDSTSANITEQAANPTLAPLEPEILSEINRVRTNPQGYAQWLEEQRQYYDGIWLKLPGEKPVRTNKGLKALEEAIAVLKEQKPLSALDISEATSATATNKLSNFATANNIQNISYGRVTPKGIVMSLVVDELFPDRRRRQSLLSPNANDTGVVCKPDPRYAKVCAIAYSDTASNVEVAKGKPEAEPENVAVFEGSQEEEATPQETANTLNTSETSDNSGDQAAVEQPETEETIAIAESPTINESDNSSDETTEVESLPEPGQLQTPPGFPATVLPTPEAEAQPEPEETEIAEAQPEPEEDIAAEETEAEETEIAEAQPELEVTEVEDEPEEDIAAEETEAEETEIAIAEPEPEPELESEIEPESEEVAINSSNSGVLENIERGALEEGDRTIPDDGSFYDSYAIQGKRGDSFTIYLESNEFDPFVALIDDKGNIIEQNDDISEENSNSKIQVTIPEDGSYNVIVNAYDEGGKGEYVLTVDR